MHEIERERPLPEPDEPGMTQSCPPTNHVGLSAYEDQHAERDDRHRHARGVHREDVHEQIRLDGERHGRCHRHADAEPSPQQSCQRDAGDELEHPVDRIDVNRPEPETGVLVHGLRTSGQTIARTTATPSRRRSPPRPRRRTGRIMNGNST